MLRKRFPIFTSVIFLITALCFSCFKINGNSNKDYSKLRTSSTDGILSAKNDFLSISLNITTGIIELRDKEGTLVLKGTSDYSITDGKVIENTYNYDLNTIKIVSPMDYKSHKWLENTTYSSKGEGREFIITHTGYQGYPDLIQKIKVDEEGTTVYMSMSLSAGDKAVPTPLLISELRVLGFEMTEKEDHWFTPVKKNVLMERQGTRRPSDRRVLVALDNEKFPDNYNFGGYNKWMRRETDTELKYISESLATFVHSDIKNTLFLGFVTQHRQATHIMVRRKKNDSEYLGVSCRCDIEGNPYGGQQILNSEVLMLDFISQPNDAKDAYVLELKEIHGQPGPKVSVGRRWSSWGYYRKYITEDGVIKNMDAMKKLGFQVDHIHIDDGYQDNENEWLGGNNRFPHGMKWMAEEIIKRGFTAGLWINPFITLATSNFSRQHPECLLRNKNGQLLEVTQHNLGLREASGAPYPLPVAYIVDFTVPASRQWLRNLIRTLVQWGYTEILLDGPWRDYYYLNGPRGPFADPSETTIGNWTTAFEIMREEMGEKVLLTGEGYFGPSYGYADAHNVSQDATTDPVLQLQHNMSRALAIYPWPRQLPHPSSNIPSTSYRTTYKRSPLYEKWILPDTLYAGENRSNYTGTAMRQAKTMTFGSGQLYDLNAEDEKRLHQFLPTYASEVKSLDDSSYEAPSPGQRSRGGRNEEKKISCTWGEWSLLGLFNQSGNTEKEVSVPINRLSVPQGNRYYHAFDFWREQYLGKSENEIRVKIPPSDAYLLSVRAASDHPEILSTNMHYTQGAVELQEVIWDDRKKKLHFSSDFDYQVDVKIYIYVPENYSIREIHSSGVDNLTNKLEGELVTLSYKKGEPKTDFTITFGKRRK